MTVLKSPLSSGDLIADSRYEYAAASAADGDFSAAADLFEQALERAPDWPAALFGLGQAREGQGRPETAADAYRRTLAADPDDVLCAAAPLARLGGAARSTGFRAPMSRACSTTTRPVSRPMSSAGSPIAARR